MNQPPQQPPYGGSNVPPTTYVPQNPGSGSNYPQQPGYPQQGGYPSNPNFPQQPGYPQQGGYPSNPNFPQQPGYPQQGGYPQQQPGSYPQYPQYQQPGIPGDLPPYQQPPAAKKKTPLIIGAIALALVVVIVAVVIFATRPSGPPSSWVTTDTSAKSLGYLAADYIHWDNNNGDLKGTMEVFLVSKTGLTLDNSANFTGTYDSATNKVTLKVTQDGKTQTLVGTIKDDTLQFNSIDGSPAPSTAPVYHPGNASDFDKAKTDAKNQATSLNNQ